MNATTVCTQSAVFSSLSDVLAFGKQLGYIRVSIQLQRVLSGQDVLLVQQLIHLLQGFGFAETLLTLSFSKEANRSLFDQISSDNVSLFYQNETAFEPFSFVLSSHFLNYKCLVQNVFT